MRHETNDKKLQNKSILMFSNHFFNYNEMITEQLSACGAQIDFYDERPNNRVLTKIMLRYNVKMIRPTVEKYYRGVIEENRDKQYDYIFVIKSESITPKIIAMLRKAYPAAQLILYMWDAVDNIPDGAKKIPCYDRVLTFDPVDVKKYGLILRPLFYAKNFEQAESKAFYRYDVSFVGTAHSIRPKIASVLKKYCDAQGRNSFFYLFLPSKVVYFYHKLTNPAYRKVKLSHIHFMPLEAQKVRAICDDSRCILDVEHNKQRGLTMRTIEMLGMGKKIITTNSLVRDYDFYNPNNICIIDREKPEVPDDFWNAAYEPISNEIIEYYSLKHFVEDVFNV